MPPCASWFDPGPDKCPRTARTCRSIHSILQKEPGKGEVMSTVVMHNVVSVDGCTPGRLRLPYEFTKMLVHERGAEHEA